MKTNTQTNKYRLLYSSTSYVNSSVLYSAVRVCVCYIQFAEFTSVYVVCSYVESNSVLRDAPLLLCRQQG